jgi:hypothetical protein
MLFVFNTMVALWWVGLEESEANKKIEFYSALLVVHSSKVDLASRRADGDEQ